MLEGEASFFESGVAQSSPPPLLTSALLELCLSMPLRVGIVGAGPGGLVMGIALARRGHRVEVFESLAPLGALCTRMSHFPRCKDAACRRVELFGFWRKRAQRAPHIIRSVGNSRPISQNNRRRRSLVRWIAHPFLKRDVLARGATNAKMRTERRAQARGASRVQPRSELPRTPVSFDTCSFFCEAL